MPIYQGTHSAETNGGWVAGVADLTYGGDRLSAAQPAPAIGNDGTRICEHPVN